MVTMLNTLQGNMYSNHKINNEIVLLQYSYHEDNIPIAGSSLPARLAFFKKLINNAAFFFRSAWSCFSLLAAERRSRAA